MPEPDAGAVRVAFSQMMSLGFRVPGAPPPPETVGRMVLSGRKETSETTMLIQGCELVFLISN